MAEDILIVGAGPTGLMMASLLARAGISFRIIDRQKDRAQESRALVVHAKTMELFQNLGLDQQFLKVGKKSIGLGLFVDGEAKLKIDFGDIGIEGTPFPYLFFISQAETEQILIDHLTKNGITIERETELVEFDQDNDGVNCTIKNKEGTEEKNRYQYLLGCDGAHSRVREGLNLGFPGGSYEQNFVLADADIQWPYEKDRLMIFMTVDGILAHFPLNDKVSRLIITQTRPPKNQSAKPDVEEIETLAQEFSKIRVKVSNPIWLARFHLHHRGVNQYRVGRCFVAGDAAHIHSPVGGQGMNTGIQDAANLAWKLSMVIKHGASEKLLDTYHNERHRIGQILLKTTDRFFSVAVTKNRILAKLRNTILPKLAKTFLSTPSGRHQIFRFVSQLAIRYHDPLLNKEDVVGDGFDGGIEPGCRAPDAETETGSLFQQLMGEKFHILIFNGLGDKSLKLPPNDFFGDTFAAHCFARSKKNEILFQRYGIRDEGVYIIRPDGYVLFRSDKIDFDAMRLKLRHFLAIN